MSWNLLLLPEVTEEVMLTAMVGQDYLVLDSVLYGKEFGFFFRRMRVRAALEPGYRVEFAEMRHRFLKQYLAGCVVREGATALLVGSDVRDIDLVEYANVAIARVDQAGLIEIGEAQYGDPYVTLAEYASVMSVARESADFVLPMKTIRELRALVNHWLGTELELPVVEYKNKFVRFVAGELGVDDAMDALESELRFSPDKLSKSPVYEYLLAIRGEWRDAVARMLPVKGDGHVVMEAVLRLPMFVVDVQAVSQWHYQLDIAGQMTIAVRGDGLLLERLRNLSPEVLPPSDYVGTWVGAMLFRSECVSDLVATCVETVVEPTVGREYEVSDPCLAGLREAANLALMGDGPDDPEMARFLRAMEVALVAPSVRERIALLMEGHVVPTDDDKIVLLQFVPGYQYLMKLMPLFRVEAVSYVGRLDPANRATYASLHMVPATHLAVSPTDWLAEIERSSLIPQRSVTYPLQQGCCYTVVVARSKWREAKIAYGTLPTVRVLKEMPVDQRGPGWGTAYVVDRNKHWPDRIVHLTNVYTSGAVLWEDFVADPANGDCRVGQSSDSGDVADGTCLPEVWRSLAVAAISILVAEVVVGCFYLLYLKCRSPRQLGYRR